MIYTNKNYKLRHIGVMFILPFAIFYIVFVAYPLIQGIILSFYKWDLYNAPVFVSLDNFVRVLKDPVFLSSLGHTLKFTFFLVPTIIIFSFSVSVLLYYISDKYKSIAQAVLFLPSMFSVSIVAILWLYMLQPNTGFISTVISQFNFEHQLLWLSDENLVWFSVVVITVWWTMGYDILIYTSSLKTLNSNMFEAATIDGANWFQQIIHIIIPCLKKTHYVILFLEITASLKVFSQIYLLTSGGPAGSTRTIVQYIYEKAFVDYYVGVACASGVLFFILIIGFSLISIFIKRTQN